MVFGGEGEEAAIESIIHEEGCKAICWRDVPIEPSAIGDDARAVMPRIRQLFIAADAGDIFLPSRYGLDNRCDCI